MKAAGREAIGRMGSARMTRPASSSDGSVSPVADTPPLPGGDDPEARARTIDNLNILGLATGWHA